MARGVRTRSSRSCGTRRDRVERAARWAVVLLLGLNMTGCALLNPAPVAPIAVPESCMAEQSEIDRLRQLLAEKEALIRSQQARQQEQAKELQATTREASRAQVKLSRLATQPDAASTLAEVEVAMETLKSVKTTVPQRAMQAQAQKLLDAANAAYEKGDFATAVDRATQSREILDMLQGLRAMKTTRNRVTVTFQAPIPLRTRIDSNLRQLPRGNAKILSVLKKDTALMAQAYRGPWLRIQTEDGRTGWVFNRLVEARPDEP
jgi:predicted GNAT family N-acyltransferase